MVTGVLSNINIFNVTCECNVERDEYKFSRPLDGMEKYLCSTSIVNLFHSIPVSADICMFMCVLDKIRNTKL